MLRSALILKKRLYINNPTSEHTELTWIFDTLTTMPYLMRAHAFKDAEAKSKEISVGKFNYPMLMAADILLYDPGSFLWDQDQKQHVEITRDTAESSIGHLQEGDIQIARRRSSLKDVALVPGIDGQKMSKSYNNTNLLFATDEEIKKRSHGHHHRFRLVIFPRMSMPFTHC